jgi:hypothetical protein
LTTGTARGQPLKRRWKDRKRKRTRSLYYTSMSYRVDEGDGFGFYDLDVDRDWGLLYKLKKEWIAEAPEFKYRIVTRSTNKTWSEVFNDEI